MTRARAGRMTLVLLTAVLLLVVSVGEPPSVARASEPVAGGTLRYGQSGDIDTLDPWNATGNGFLVVRQIFETLVEYAPTSFDIKPALATQWSVSSDGLQWTFMLRDGVRFHDGTPVNAAAVVLNFERGRMKTHPARGKPVGSQFSFYPDMWGGFDNDSIITKVEARDSRAVVFTTKTPFGPFLANLAMPSFSIVSPKSIQDDPDGWSLPGSKGAAGTGPFMFKPGAWQKDQQVTLSRNPSYWRKAPSGQALPYLDQVVFRAVKDTAARLAELKAGSLDAMRDFSPLDIATVKADPRLRVVPRPPFNLGYIGLNVSSPPFNDLRVREAFAHAVDKNALIRALYAGEGSPATQFLVPGMLGYDESVTDFRPYDPAKAKDLLTQAGHPSGFAVDLWYMPVSRPYYPEPKKVAEVFASYLAKIGVTATLKTADWTTYRASARDNKLPMWQFGWIGDNGDPDNFLNVFFHPKMVDGKETATDFGAWIAPEVWQLLRKAQTETRPEVRADLYKQVSRIVHKEIPRIPVVYAKPPTAATAKVHDYVPHPSNSEPLTLVWMER